MSWAELYQKDTTAAVNAAGSLPPMAEPEKERPFFGVGALKAPFTGSMRGMSEAAASFFDVTKAAGMAYATTHSDPNELFDATKREEGVRARAAAKQRLDSEIKAGTSFVTDEGESVRKYWDFLAPDAKTASTAENLVYSFARVGTKIAAGSLMGPGGVAIAGAEEGFTQSEDLRKQGVDIGTRTKVGAVTAGFTSLAPLPLYGGTLAKTAGLYVIGGPGGFMAQQQASRSILEAADYGEIAKQFDPLDSVGLWASALIPLPFAVKGGLKSLKTKSADATPSLKDVEPQAPKVSQEHVDAAMTYNMVRMGDAQAKVVPLVEAATKLRTSVAAATIEPAAVVNTQGALPDGPPVVVRETEGVTIISGADEITAARAEGRPVDVVEIPRAEYEALKETHSHEDIATAAMVARDQKAQIEAESPPKEAVAPEPVAPEIVPPKEITAAREAARKIEAEGKTFEEVKASLKPEEANLLAGILEAGRNTRKAEAILDDYARGVLARPNEPRVNIAADAVEAAREGRVSTPEPEGVKAEQAAEDGRDMTSRRVDEIMKNDPDMPVGKDAEGKTITAEEAMKDARRQGVEGTADELGTRDIGLVDAAIACALMFGVAA